MSKQKRSNQANYILPDETFPLFQLEQRKLKWASTPEKAIRSLVWISIPIIVSLIAVWAAFIYRDSRFTQYWDYWYQNYMWIVFGATMTILSGILDFSAMVVTFGSIRDEKVLGRWDLLVLATDKEQITRSKHTFARLRITRVLILNLAVRFAVLLMLGLSLIFHNYFFGYGGYYFWQEFFWQVREYPFAALGIGIGISLICYAYLIEPIWRVNAITAMGVALSARIKNIALLAPMAFFVLVLMWILQGLVLAATTYAMGWIGMHISNFYWDHIARIIETESLYPQYERIYYDIANWIGALSILFAMLIYLFVANRFYRILKGIAYGRIYAKIP